MRQRYMLSVKPSLFQHIFFDLDGTLLDNSERLYSCYRDILASAGEEPLSKNQYMYMKRNKASLSSILKECQTSPSTFNEKWMELIETKAYLALDVLKPGAESTLTKGKQYAERLILITRRRKRDALLEQLSALGILDFFDEVFTPLVNKADFLSNFPAGKAVFVGDTEEDRDAAAAINAVFVGITTGLRTPELLRADVSYEATNDINWPDLARLKK